MDYKNTINEIFARANKLNVDKRDLCRAAEISTSTLYRWQQDDANPRLRDLTVALQRMTDHLDQTEAKLREWLDASPHQEISA